MKGLNTVHTQMVTGIHCHNGGLTKDAVSVREAMSNKKNNATKKKLTEFILC